MFTSLRRIIAAGAGGLILLVSIIQPSFASPQEPSSYIVVGGVGTSVTTPAEREDLENVARSLGISFEQALDRFAGQEDFAAVVDAIRQSDSSTFSTANWEPGPDYKAWISFHGTPSDQVLQMISRLPFPVAVRTSSPASELSLIQAQIEARDDVAQLDGVKAADSTVEDSTGEIVVSVYIAEGYTPESVLDSAQQAANKAVRRISDAITVKAIQSDFIQAIPAAIVGGNATSGCTGAFTVTSSGSTGISSAGHCPDGTFTYGGASATFVQQSSPSSGDVQWHSLGGAAITNKFRYTTGGSTRVVTSAVNPVNNTAICYWGLTTGNNCGTVHAVNYCDTAGYCLLFRAGPSIVQPGDSGGPWYYGNVAKGVTRGWIENGFGFRLDDIATRVGALNLINTVVKITP